MHSVSFAELVPELTDGVVRLRAHRASDIPRIVEQNRDPEMLRWTTLAEGYDENRAQQWLDHIAASWQAGPLSAEFKPHWAICTVEDDTYLGAIDLRPSSGGAAGVGYGLHPGARGDGLMARALRLACQWWFANGGERVHWAAFRGHIASWKTAWACGFTMHATVPGATAQRGVLRDDWIASVGRLDDLDTPKTPWLTQPEFTVATAAGWQIRLRHWRPDDVDAIEDPDHPEHFLPHRAIPPREGFESWRLSRVDNLVLGQGLNWCIADAATDRALGYVTVFSRGWQITDFAELGYYLFPSARGRGVIAAATRSAVAHALRTRSEGGLGVRRLVALTAADNDASNRVLSGLGFEVFGRERAVDVLPDGYGDLLHWQLLPGVTTDDGGR